VNLELFPCSGGMAEGFRRAGVTFDLAIEWDEYACDSYEANLGHRPRQMDVREFLRDLRRRKNRPAYAPRRGEVDLLVADPPCTPWSRAGSRKGQADERDMLGDTMAIIAYLRPTRWIVANVPGLDDSQNWASVVWPVVGEPAWRMGYCVDYASLNAADYGVAQLRRRPFWVAHRIGTPCIRWPAPTHADPATLTSLPLPGVEPLEPWVTCRQALGHLPLDELGVPVTLRWRNPDHRASAPDEPAKTQTRNTNSDGCLLVNPRHVSREDEPANVQCASGNRQAAIVAPPRQVGRWPRNGKGGGGGGHLPSRADEPALVQTAATGSASQVMVAADAWPWDRPSTTVLNDERIPPPGHHSGSSEGVKLSERARLILQGFPEGWQLLAPTKTGRSSMLGQAMPPPLAEAVARATIEQARDDGGGT